MYHVEVIPKVWEPPHRREEQENDLLFEELERRFLAPYRKAKPIVIRGRTIATDDIHRIRIYETQQEIGTPASIPLGPMADVTKEFITGPPGWELEEGSADAKESRPPANTREVFVVHGRNNEARDALFDFLRAIDLHPLEWSEVVQSTGKPSPYIGEILDAAFSQARAVVVLFTPDDEARLKKQFRSDSDPPHEAALTGQARPNVLFEAGMAMARSQEWTVLVELGHLRPFTDIAGIHVVRMDGSSQRRQELGQRLRTAGCPANLDGTDWHTAGDFEGAVAQLPQGSPESAGNGEQHSPRADLPQLSKDARELLVEAVKDKGRMIRIFRTMGGLSISAGSKSFGEMGNARSEARWEQAIQDLLDQELVVDPRGKGRIFEVTHKGFEIADGLGTSQ